MRRHLDRILSALGAWIGRHPWLVVGSALLVAAACSPFALHILTHLDSDIFNQVSQKLERFRSLKELSVDFGGDILAAAVSISEASAKDDAKVAELKAFGELLAAELKKVGTSPEDRQTPVSSDFTLPEGPWLRNIECRIGQAQRESLLQLGRENPHAILNAASLAALKARFEGPALESRMKEVRNQLENADSLGVERKRITADPLNLAALFEETLKANQQGSHGPVGNEREGGYFLSKDRTILLVLARPVRDARVLDFNRALIAACLSARLRAAQAFRAGKPALEISDEEPLNPKVVHKGPKGKQLDCGFIGIHAVAVENEQSLRYDIILNTATAGLFVMLIYLLIYRSLRVAFCVVLSLGLAVHFTLAAAWGLHGTIGVIGAGFTAILIGMGEDYAVYLHNTFQDLQSKQGFDAVQGLSETLRLCGPNILTAAIAAAAAFFSICTTHFRGLAELGLLAGMGLTFSAILMLTFFPALMVLCEARHAAKPASWMGRLSDTISRLQMSPRGRTWCLAAGLLGCLPPLLLVILKDEPPEDRVLGVPFDGEFANLRSVRVRAVPLRNRVAQRFGLGLTELRVEVTAQGEEEAFAALQEVRARLKPEEDRRSLVYGGSITDLLRNREEQLRNIQSLRDLDLAARADDFLAAAKKEFGEKAGNAFGEFVDKLRKWRDKLNTATALSLENIQAQPLMGYVTAPFVRIDKSDGGQRTRLLTYYYPQSLDSGEAWYGKIAHLLEDHPPPSSQIRVTGARMVGFEMKHHFFADMVWITVIVAGSVLLLVWLKYRSAHYLLLALLPLLFGYLWVLGGVQLGSWLGWDLTLNYVNLIVFPLLLGTGIDYGIYLVSDAREAPEDERARCLAKTGLSVFIACLTTLAGFGSMVFSSHTGLISFGWVALLGYGGTLFGALVVLPVLLAPKGTHPVPTPATEMPSENAAI